MKQLAQNNRTGHLHLIEVPIPIINEHQVLVRTLHSVISPGTESRKVATAKRSLVGKARERPDLVKQVIETSRREGLLSTYHKVSARLDTPSSLGYSSAGEVVAVGSRVQSFRAGDQVACAGEGYAAHSEYVAVPHNLCAQVPYGVPMEQAAFATLGAIAMNGVRQAEVRIGEAVAVIGLGLIGQLTTQLLRAAGCRVLGIDLDESRLELAMKGGGAEAAARPGTALLQAESDRITNCAGFDAVIVTASSRDSAPLQMASELSRSRGKVVLVGMVPMVLDRQLFYEKELDLRMSRSYGPGRYDPIYEEGGIDYPHSYVRWTEQRNLASFLQLIRAGSIDISSLITHRITFTDAPTAYGNLGRGAMAVVFSYSRDAGLDIMEEARSLPLGGATTTIGVGLLGAGSFAGGTLLPILRSDRRVRLRGVSSQSGLSAAGHVGPSRFAFSAEPQKVIDDSATAAVLIATRHDSHANLAIQAMLAGKAVFVEKPLCINIEDLGRLIDAQAQSQAMLMVGFNRRFAPLTARLAAHFRGIAPLTMIYRVNAGYIPKDHWTQDPLVGGGRILGEVCHFIDYLQYVSGSPPSRVHTLGMANAGRYSNDNVTISLGFLNGSIGTIVYTAAGGRRLPKERIEIHGGGASGILDDFRSLSLFRDGRTERHGSAQDKGHRGELKAFLDGLKSGQNPVRLRDSVAATLASFAALESLTIGATVPIDPNRFEMVSTRVLYEDAPPGASNPIG